MLSLTWKNLFQSKTQFLLGIGGVTLAMLLMLSLDALLTGSEDDLVAYIEQSGADIIISQEGVLNMHMAVSVISESDVRQAVQIEGVQSASPILLTSSILRLPNADVLSYVIGFDPREPLGGPLAVISGTTDIRDGEIIIDAAVARTQHIQLEDKVEIFGEAFKVVGITSGLTNIINSVAFIHVREFQRLVPGEGVSYGLVKNRYGADANAIARMLMTDNRDITALTLAEFSFEERQIIRDMAVDILNVMSFAGFLIGLAVTALTLYINTLNKQREYGVLKAIGASNWQLYRIVLGQAFLSLFIGLGVAVILVQVLGYLLPSLIPGVGVRLAAASVGRVLLAALVIGLVSVGIPVRQIARLDPAVVFRN